MTKLGLYLATWTLVSSCLASPDIHKRMTPDQLQSIFHVEEPESVPHYELVQLTHHGISSIHKINRRSINNQQEVSVKESHHVKKDLSKSPYYSELKITTEQHGGNSLSDHELSDKIKNLDLSNINEHNVSFSAFGEVLNLTLRPTDGLFKDGPQGLRMWTARPEPNATQGVEYEEVQPDASASEHIGEIFQDEENMAAILMRRQLETGDLVMEGSIGHELVIKPLPHELRADKEVAHHVVFKRQIDYSDQFSDFAFMEPDRLQRHYRERRSTAGHQRSVDNAGEEDTVNVNEDVDDESSASANKRSKRAAPHIIYPEILVIVDYDGYRLHGGDNVQVKRYFVSFWNGVDLRYRLLKGPRIRISIAGIIISRGRDATPYLERNRVGRDAIDSAAALTDMGKYLFRERRLPVYDIAVAITKLDMCRRSYPYSECKRGTAGFAYVGGACVVNKRLEKVNSVAIIEDTGGFSGIIVAAHEVGHLLGAVHDGSPPPSYLGGPGAERCRWEDGYIMSDLRHTERGFRWSPCTVQSFHHFLNGDTATCLHNAPHEDSALGRALPGTLLSLDAQCRRDRGTYACFKDDRVCAQLFCFDSLTGYCVAYRPAAEGSSCGNGLHCLDGRCVGHHENVIPDFSQRAAYYRPVYNDDDNLDEPATKSGKSTKSSTTTSTTTTTTQPPIFSSNDRNNSPYNDNQDQYYTTTTETTSTAHHNKKYYDGIFSGFATTKRPTSINPFYYGFSKLSTTKPPFKYNHNSHNSTTIKHKLSAINPTYPTQPTKTPTQKTTTIITRKPFNYYQNLFSKNRNSSHSNSPITSRLHLLNSTTSTISTTATTTTVTQPTPAISTTSTTTPPPPPPPQPITTTTTISPIQKYQTTPSSSNSGSYSYTNNNNNNGEWHHSTTKTPIRNSFLYSSSYNNSNNSGISNSGSSSGSSNNGNNSSSGGRSSSSSTTARNSFFESYFKKLASTTRSPYNFDNFAQFFRASTTTTKSPPPYATNILGDNSNKLPVNVSVAG